jgi:hypothetical protein
MNGLPFTTVFSLSHVLITVTRFNAPQDLCEYTFDLKRARTDSNRRPPGSYALLTDLQLSRSVTWSACHRLSMPAQVTLSVRPIWCGRGVSAYKETLSATRAEIRERKLGDQRVGRTSLLSDRCAAD